MGPTVSVVLPTYNRADLLPMAIDSILYQDFDDLELLIVDDGSEDRTREVVGQIQARDPRLRYKKLPRNRGIGYARDTGLRLSSGRYIALADSDDLWLPGKLKAQVQALEEYPDVDFLFGDFWNINHLAATQASGFAQSQAGFEHLSVRNLTDDLWAVDSGVETGILRADFIAAPTVLLRTELYERVGGFDPNLRTTEDLEFAFRLAVVGARFAYLSRTLIHRHKTPASVTARVYESQTDLLSCLAICRRTCKVVGREDLLSHIRDAEHRAWRNLIQQHCNEGERLGAWVTYRKSLRYGFSPRTLGLFILGLTGARAMSLAVKLRARSPRPSW